MSIPRLVVVQTGTAAPEIVRRHGDYPDWFNQAIGAELPVLRAYLGEPLELPVGSQGVLVTGSPLSLTLPEPWMDEVAEEMRKQQIASVDEVAWGILETNGTMSFISK